MLATKANDVLPVLIVLPSARIAESMKLHPDKMEGGRDRGIQILGDGVVHPGGQQLFPSPGIEKHDIQIRSARAENWQKPGVPW